MKPQNIVSTGLQGGIDKQLLGDIALGMTAAKSLHSAERRKHRVDTCCVFLPTVKQYGLSHRQGRFL